MVGALAGIAATLLVYPLEVVRIRMIFQCTHTGPRHVVRVLQGMRWIYHHEGMRGLSRGSVAAIVGGVPFEGIQFPTYDCGKRWLTQLRTPCELSRCDHLLLGNGASG
jgi:hypothetical protein